MGVSAIVAVGWATTGGDSVAVLVGAGVFVGLGSGVALGGWVKVGVSVGKWVVVGDGRGAGTTGGGWQYGNQTRTKRAIRV